MNSLVIRNGNVFKLSFLTIIDYVMQPHFEKEGASPPTLSSDYGTNYSKRCCHPSSSSFLIVYNLKNPQE